MKKLKHIIHLIKVAFTNRFKHKDDFEERQKERHRRIVNIVNSRNHD